MSTSKSLTTTPLLLKDDGMAAASIGALTLFSTESSYTLPAHMSPFTPAIFTVPQIQPTGCLEKYIAQRPFYFPQSLFKSNFSLSLQTGTIQESQPLQDSFLSHRIPVSTVTTDNYSMILIGSHNTLIIAEIPLPITPSRGLACTYHKPLVPTAHSKCTHCRADQQLVL